MTIYGIKTCDSVRKAIKFMKEQDLSYAFVDLKKTPVDEIKINSWLADVPMEKLFNTRGTTYRTLKLKELDLDDAGKKEWLAKENLLIKRPIIENKGEIIVGFDATLYTEKFLK